MGRSTLQTISIFPFWPSTVVMDYLSHLALSSEASLSSWITWITSRLLQMARLRLWVGAFTSTKCSLTSRSATKLPVKSILALSVQHAHTLNSHLCRWMYWNAWLRAWRRIWQVPFLSISFTKLSALTVVVARYMGYAGLVSDNIVAMKVVTADGRSVKVSKSSNPDLYWAMRGAGHNFGIVTEFKHKIFDYPNGQDTYYVTYTFTEGMLESFFELYNRLLGNGTLPNDANVYAFYYLNLDINPKV